MFRLVGEEREERKSMNGGKTVQRLKLIIFKIDRFVMASVEVKITHGP